MTTITTYTGNVPNRQTQTQLQFDAAMDTTLEWLLGAPDEYNAVASEVSADAASAASSANSANSAKVAAELARDEAQLAVHQAVEAGVSAAGAPAYPNGSPYDLGECCYGPDGHTYRSKTNGNTANPVTHPTNWTKLTGVNADVQAILEMLDGIGTAALSDVEDFATAAQGAKADSALQINDVGTAALYDVEDFATAAQGAKADSALQPADLFEIVTPRSVSFQYDANDRIVTMTETLDDGAVRATAYVYNANGLVSKITVTIGGISTRTVFSYSGTKMTGWSTEEVV